MRKMIHLVCDTGIRTHNLLYLNLLPQPLDQGYRPILGNFAQQK